MLSADVVMGELWTRFKRLVPRGLAKDLDTEYQVPLPVL